MSITTKSLPRIKPGNWGEVFLTDIFPIAMCFLVNNPLFPEGFGWAWVLWPVVPVALIMIDGTSLLLDSELRKNTVTRPVSVTRDPRFEVPVLFAAAGQVLFGITAFIVFLQDTESAVPVICVMAMILWGLA